MEYRVGLALVSEGCLRPVAGQDAGGVGEAAYALLQAFFQLLVSLPWAFQLQASSF